MNEAVKRNSNRFPVDFMFRLSSEEYTSLISKIAISKPGRRGDMVAGSGFEPGTFGL